MHAPAIVTHLVDIQTMWPRKDTQSIKMFYFHIPSVSSQDLEGSSRHALPIPADQNTKRNSYTVSRQALWLDLVVLVAVAWARWASLVVISPVPANLTLRLASYTSRKWCPLRLVHYPKWLNSDSTIIIKNMGVLVNCKLWRTVPFSTIEMNSL